MTKQERRAKRAISSANVATRFDPKLSYVSQERKVDILAQHGASRKKIHFEYTDRFELVPYVNKAGVTVSKVKLKLN